MSLYLRINNNLVEVDADGLEAPLTFSVADMKQPDKRRTSSSKTIRLHGTQRNLNLLRNVYSLPITDLENPLQFTFDPRQRIEAIYEINGVTVFDGLFQVLKAIRNGESYEFECLLLSNIANVIQELGDLKISDLPWNEYNHELNKTNIRNSWDTSVIRDGAPVTNFASGVPNGFGYIYGWFDLGYLYPNNKPHDQKTNQLIAGVYFREVLEKMMAFIGQPYTFTMNDEALWRRLTLFNEAGVILNIDDEAATNRSAEIQQNLPNIITTPNAIFTANAVNNQLAYNFSQPLVVSNIVDDPNEQVQPNNTIVIGAAGTYNVAIEGSFGAVVTSNVFNITQTQSTVQVSLFRNGVEIGIALSEIVTTTPTTYSWNVDNDYIFEEGDIIEVRLTVGINGQANTGQFVTVTLTNNFDIETTLTAIDGELTDGDLVNITRYLPRMKCADFYRSIMRMFNLYQEDTDNGIRITPAINYFGGTNSNQTLNWSDKLDYSELIEIEPPNRIEGKNYIFRYKQEDDHFHELYRQEFGTSYGDTVYTVPNTWQVGDNVVELEFSIGIPATASIGDTATEVIMPAIYKFENNNATPYKGKAARVYVYNGIINVPQSDACALFDSELGAADTEPEFITNSGDWGYPSFHHLLNPLAPTFDILFSPTNRLYYSDGLITNNTLFVKYWDRFIRELTSADSKILTAYFKLTNLDIHNLDFKKLINIDGVVYRLNMVFDYVGQNQSTKCELIKVIEASSRQTKTNLPIGTLPPEELAPNPNNVLPLPEADAIVLKNGQIGFDRLTEVIMIRTPFGVVKIQGELI